eukprot:CAMPEP_0168380646 /NCGR_PEP_ID=MMETSP0228-20121227/12470_1 /TAXON_ID=133427 /ORGANISM="Protoceratium reticulatum, Strain CCCM 535 (=CCMP 1889)" /LENGTH=148 /DNA_ID=CAMNT_0008393723 /DNA_START=81 /DNA_END=527 /DNA_ORIENTATION=+
MSGRRVTCARGHAVRAHRVYEVDDGLCSPELLVAQGSAFDGAVKLRKVPSQRLHAEAVACRPALLRGHGRSGLLLRGGARHLGENLGADVAAHDGAVDAEERGPPLAEGLHAEPVTGGLALRNVLGLAPALQLRGLGGEEQQQARAQD